LPLTRAKFERGELSYSQVRALSRTARPDSEAELLRVARFCSGDQIERLTRGMRRAKRLNSRYDQKIEDDGPRMGMQVGYEGDGSVEITLRLPIEQATVILAAVDTVRDQLEAHAKQAAAEQAAAAADPAGSQLTPTDVPPEPPTDKLSAMFGSSSEAWLPRPQVSRLQAFNHLVEDWMAMQAAGVRRRLKPRLTVQIDPHSGWGRLPNGEFLPPGITRTLDLARFDRGRTRREADPALRNLLGVLDGERCRFPGCHHTRHLHAHHVIWWKHGGPTDMDNLVLLCSRHHTLVHEQHFGMTLHHDRSLTVQLPDGTPLPHRPDLPHRSATELDPQHAIGPEIAPTPEAVDKLSLEYAVSVLVHLAA
jgi:hypothetical protein